MYLDFEFSEKDIIYILNCISLTLNFLEWHSFEEKQQVKMYFNYNNYAEEYNNLQSLHRLVSLKGNRVIYNLIDDVFFRGQVDYMTFKNFDFLNDKNRYINNVTKVDFKKEKTVNQISNSNNFFIKIKKMLDKNREIV